MIRRTPLRKRRPTPRRTAGKRPQARKTSLMAQADRLARALVLRRAGAALDAKLRVVPLTGACEHCGQPPRDGDPLQWCHVFTRRRYVLRWDLDGAVAMLASCHRRYTSDPEAWRAFLISRLGELGYVDLYHRSKQTMGGSITVGFYRQLIADLSARLKAATR